MMVMENEDKVMVFDGLMAGDSKAEGLDGWGFQRSQITSVQGIAILCWG